VNDRNQCILTGRVTKTPVLAHTRKGDAYCEMSLAVNRTYRDGSGAEKREIAFINVMTWTTLAETCAAQAVKGSALRLEGSIKQDRWQTPEGPRSRLYVLAHHVEFKSHSGKDAPQEVFAESEQPPEDLSSMPHETDAAQRPETESPS